MKKRVSALFLFSLILISGSATTALTGWEAGTVIGFDTNVDRSIDGGKSDGFLSGYVGLARTPMGGKRWDLTLSATLEGSAYASVSGLDYVAVAISPGIVIIPHALWTVTVSPFLKWKGVKDQDQSSVAFGGKASLEERIRRNLYLGQYYAYTDSRADVDTFSFSEHSLGAYIGVVATSAARVELGYEFSRGDSFRTLGTSASIPPGSGMHGRFSSAFGAEVVREDVDRHAVFLSAAVDWTPSLFSRAGYTFTDTEGDLGSSLSHSGFAGVGYRF